MDIPGQPPVPSTLDQLVAVTLMLLGVIVLIRRRREVTSLLKASWPIVLYFTFAVLSVLWSDYPGWGFKRWIRALGDLIMVLLVATDAQPVAALRRLLSRVGFVLLPASVLLIKYYPNLGRGFSQWGDGVFNTGVTTNKNSLGVLVLFVALGALWQVIALLRDKTQPNRTRRLLAQGTLLYFGISLLFMAHSATSGACFVLGAGLMLAMALPFFRARPAAVNALVLALLLSGGLTILLGGYTEAVKAMGRNQDLTGRREIWKMVIPMVPNSMVGAGFETFWVGPRVERFFANYGGIHRTNEAHNGYIEVYLNLGWIGVGLIALILGQGYRRAVRALRRGSALGALLVAYVVTAAVYSIGEAGFRMMGISWIFLLLSVAAANRVISLRDTTSEPDRELDRPPAKSETPSPNPAWTQSVRPAFLS
jgi:O-antigen ligase